MLRAELRTDDWLRGRQTADDDATDISMEYHLSTHTSKAQVSSGEQAESSGMRACAFPNYLPTPNPSLSSLRTPRSPTPETSTATASRPMTPKSSAPSRGASRLAESMSLAPKPLGPSELEESGANAAMREGSIRKLYSTERGERKFRRTRKHTTQEEANFQCKVKGCGKYFSRSYNFKSHMETHDEKREYPFPCTQPNCTKKFVRKTDLQRHYQSVHTKQRNHKCEYCGRMFARKDTLRRHTEDGCTKRFMVGMDVLPLDLSSPEDKARAVLGNGSKTSSSPSVHAFQATKNNTGVEHKETSIDVMGHFKAASNLSRQSGPELSPKAANLDPEDRHFGHPPPMLKVHGQDEKLDDSGLDETSSESSDADTTSTGSSSEGSSSTDSSTSSSKVSFTSRALNANKRHLLERLIAEFTSLLDQNLTFRSRGRGTGTPNRSTSTSSLASPSSSHQAPADSNRKRQRSDDEENSNSQDEEDRNNTKRPKIDLRDSTVTPRKFACPYHRRNPQKHTEHRSCAGPGWKSVHRVKEHIYRAHAMPIYCARCCVVFKTETDLTAHQRLPRSCGIGSAALPEGFTKEQEKKLKKRTRTTASEEEKWRAMYTVIFPFDDLETIPTPYYENDEAALWQKQRDNEFDELEQYLRRELPRVVRRRFEQLISGFTDPIENQLRSQLVDIVRDSQSELFRSYRQTGQLSSEGHSTTSAGDQQQALPLDEEPPQFLDFSAFLAPPPLSPLSGDYVRLSFTEPFLCNPTAGEQRLASDSGYGSNVSGAGPAASEQTGADGERTHTGGVEQKARKILPEDPYDDPTWWLRDDEG